MAPEECNFSRLTHLSDWSKMLHAAFRHQLHTDVTIICEGRQLRAHRSVLASLSPFLKEILLDADPTVEPVIILSPEFEYEPILQLLNFFYHGSVDTTGDLRSLSQYAKELQVEGMKLQLLELKQAVLIQLDNLSSSDSESSSSDSDDEEVAIIYENTKKSSPTPKIEQPDTPPPQQNAVKRPPSRSFNENPQPKKRNLLPQVRSSKCSVCKQTFETKAELVQHLQSHSNVLECGICKKILSTKASLKRHLNLHVQQVNLILQAATSPQESDLFSAHGK